MALRTAPIPIGRLRGSTRVVAGQGMTPDARLDELRVEAVAAVDEALAAADRIVYAAMADSRMGVVNEANRMAYRLSRCRVELLRLGGGDRAA